MQNFTVRNGGEQKPRKKHGCLWLVCLGALLYIGMCAWMGYLMGGMFSAPATKLEANSVYKLKLSGTLVEQGQEANPFAALLSSNPYYSQDETVGLDELLSNIRLAKTDDRILGIYLEGGSLSMAPASAKALRDALLDFKTSGKWIIAYASSYGQTNYYVASVADKIYLNPTASIDWNGLSAQKMYYTRLMDKLGIEMQILKVGTFKSADAAVYRRYLGRDESRCIGEPAYQRGATRPICRPLYGSAAAGKIHRIRLCRHAPLCAGYG